MRKPKKSWKPPVVSKCKMCGNDIVFIKTFEKTHVANAKHMTPHVCKGESFPVLKYPRNKTVVKIPITR